MSVLIKGIEMPKNGCSDCVLVNRKWTGDVCKILKKEVSGNVERGGFQTDCPLIEVPDHGRLIDADALIDYCKHFAAMYKDSTLLTDRARRDELLSVIGEIIHMPTIIPAEPAEEGE